MIDSTRMKIKKRRKNQRDGGEMVTELKELISEKIPFPHDAHKRESVY
ncbi:hypothetical protein PP707_01025 [Acetobacter pasteurianus]|nr:hypothetical protein [Acetobacter pasteurianus]